MRRQVSLLLAHGHPRAARYPLGYLFDEAALVAERVNGMLATELQGWRMAYISAKVKEGKKPFENFIARLCPDDEDATPAKPVHPSRR